ncbi:BACON domain-containing carbohydrate-binding protein, partial [Bacteroides fragilis]
MAKASWCNVSPMSGSKNGTLTISAAAHAGREARSTTVTVTAKNGTKPSASIAV